MYVIELVIKMLLENYYDIILDNENFREMITLVQLKKQINRKQDGFQHKPFSTAHGRKNEKETKKRMEEKGKGTSKTQESDTQQKK